MFPHRLIRIVLAGCLWVSGGILSSQDEVTDPGLPVTNEETVVEEVLDGGGEAALDAFAQDPVRPWRRGRTFPDMTFPAQGRCHRLRIFRA